MEVNSHRRLLKLPVWLVDFLNSCRGTSTKSGFIQPKRNIISNQRSHAAKRKYLLHSTGILFMSQSVKNNAVFEYLGKTPSDTAAMGRQQLV